MALQSRGPDFVAIVPGLAGVVVMISMLCCSNSRSRARARSWETLLATPVDAIDALIGKLAPYVVIGTVQAAVVFYLARLLFRFAAQGKYPGAAAGRALYTHPVPHPGICLLAVAESELQAIQGAVFFYLPSMLLSGFHVSIRGMPKWARVIGEALPLTHFVRATRCVFSEANADRLCYPR